MPRRRRATQLWWAMCVWASSVAPACAEAPSFNRDIRPILANKCFQCHGPDAEARKAGLRLDRREVAIEIGAIAPGRPDESGLIERIRSADAEQRMPPAHTQKRLTPDEIELLTRWIAAGAVYQPHWSFIPVPEEVAVPRPADPSRWIRTSIDGFVLESLKALTLEPAAEAPREEWLRRVTFDLTGLPPTLSESDEFVADESTAAYERVVDRLLASAAYGEQMAAGWLDLARYADTFGYQSDRDTHVWPWRDWLIRAFNDNLSYDRFIVWQTAGDLLENPTTDQRIATAFNRLHRQTNEGGGIEEEFRLSYVSDRVQTNGMALLGLTVECARCHDHKYDPITQRDFYQLSAFFNNIDEHGTYSHFTETAPTPAMLVYEGDQTAQHDRLKEQVRAAEEELERVREAARARCAAEPRAATPALPSAAAEYSFDTASATGDYRVVPGKVGQAIEFGGDDAFVCKGAGAFTRVSPFSFALWLKLAAHRPREIVLHRSAAAEDAVYRGYSLALDDGRAVFSIAHFWPGNAIRAQTEARLAVDEWTHVTITYDGSSRAAGLGIYLNGAAAPLEVVRDSLTRDIIYRDEWGDAGDAELALGARFRDRGFKGGMIDELRVYECELSPVEARQLAGSGAAPGERAHVAHYLLRVDEPVRAATEVLQALRRAENDFVSQVPQLMVMQELPGRRQTHVLKRGAYDAPGEAVEPATPESIFPFPPAYPRDRRGFASWLIDERNPLVSRVAVNRIWQSLFGRGLVVTPEDFGTQGQPPSHPELLDWLAREFMASGWDVKQLVRLIAISAVYRQSKTPRESRLSTDDPDNRWLARGPRQRLSGEQIRDSALSASGLLDRRVGGPSVRPYQPAGLWEEAGTGKSYVQSHGADLYRRSLYTFWRRTSPPPTLAVFGAPTREVCSARRERTTTPLQALVLLNDPQFIEAARVLAERTIETHGDEVAARIDAAFRTLTSRAPSGREREILLALYREQRAHWAAHLSDAEQFLAIGERPRNAALDLADYAATTVLVQALLNHDECVSK